jgi:hypothetical protein
VSYFDLPEVQEARADLRDALDAAWQDARDHGHDDDDRPTLNEAREDDWRDEHGMWMQPGQWPTEASC